MKIKRTGGASPLSELPTKQIIKIVLMAVVGLAVVSVAFFAVYALSRSVSGKSTTPDAQKEVVLGENTEAEITCGDICMLTLPEQVDIRDVKFTSTDPDVVRVDSAGRVDGMKAGDATVTVEAFNFTASCEFHVGEAPEQKVKKEITTSYRKNIKLLKQNYEKSRSDLYSITVNRRTNTVTVYTYDADGNYTVPVRAMICSCGLGSGDYITPTGSFVTSSPRDWATLYGDATHDFVYGQYATEFNNDILFHSVPYEEMSKNKLETDEFNKLGANASQGCVRLMVSDSYWIYKNCSSNTPVKVIDADSSADPLGTPPTVKLNNNSGWDPTDPDSNNPYKDKLPTITGTEDITVRKGDSFDPLKGVAAKDICGNDMTDSVEVIGKVITEKTGVYYLTYSVTDAFSLNCTVDRLVTVK